MKTIIEKGRIMRAKVIALVALLILAIFISGCVVVDADSQEKWAHEEKMAEIKARKMTEQDKAEFADMVAEKVVERLKQEQK